MPAGSAAVLSNSFAVNPTFTADLPGIYVIQLVVNDGSLPSAPATVTVTTNALQQPTANAGVNQTVVPGALVTLSGSGTDPQALPLTYVVADYAPARQLGVTLEYQYCEPDVHRGSTGHVCRATHRR